MKKILILIGLIILFTGCTGYKTYQTINYKTLDSLVKDKESFVLVIGSASCSACSVYRQTMQSIIKEYNLMIYYVDVDNFSREEEARLIERFPFEGTPTTVFVVDGYEVDTEDRIVGAGSKEVVISLLKKYNYIKGDA